MVYSMFFYDIPYTYILHKCFFVLTSGGSSNGRTAAFGAVNLGSSPSPPAVSVNTFLLFDLPVA